MKRWIGAFVLVAAVVVGGGVSCAVSNTPSEAYGVSSGGSIHVLGSPQDAQIYIDGRYHGYVGMPPIAVGAGVHVVLVKCSGYRTLERRVFVNQSTETIQVDLAPIQ